MNKNIIIIDPQNELGYKLKNILIEYNFITEKVFSPINAYRLIKKNKSNFCILCSYDTFIKASKIINTLKKNGYKIQIILVFNTFNKIDIIKAYKNGIDDYLIMPLEYDILKCKIHCIFNSQDIKQIKLNSNKYIIGKFNFDAKTRMLIFEDSMTYILTPKESSLLELLIIKENNLLTRDKALNEIWHEHNAFTSKCMDVYITRLRRVLLHDPQLKIHNIYKLGYSLKFYR